MSKIQQVDLDATMYVLGTFYNVTACEHVGEWFPVQYAKVAYRLKTYPEKAKEILLLLSSVGRIELKGDSGRKKYCKIIDKQLPDAAWFSKYLDDLSNRSKTVVPFSVELYDTKPAQKVAEGWKPSQIMMHRGTGSGTTYEVPVNNSLSVRDSFRLAKRTTDFKTVRERQHLGEVSI